MDSATASVLTCWQRILHENGKTGQAFVHLPLNFTVNGTALVSAARKTDHKTYTQHVVLPQHLAFSRVIDVWRILYNSRRSTTHNWTVDITTGVTQKQNDNRKYVTTFDLIYVCNPTSYTMWS